MIGEAESASGAPPGLSSVAARSRLATFGLNRIAPERRRMTPARLLLKPLADPMAVLLIIAAATYLVLHDTFDAIVAAVALLPVSVVTLVLEARADRALDSLADLVSPIARVWRDGRLTTVACERIVPGDVVEVREGDVVPADGRIIADDALAVDESSLTGEAEPVRKRSGDGITSRLAAGTTVLSGRAQFVVEATGSNTRYGSIARLAAAAHPPPTPMQRRMSRLVRRLAVGAAIICLMVTAIEAWRGHSFGAGVIAGVSLAMAAIPEEFPMVYALYLALGAWRLARDNALVRRLASVETLGSATVICTDKTGTLTTGRIEVADVYRARGISDDELWTAAVLACDPRGSDPIDLAIERAAAKRGIDVEAVWQSESVYAEPFDPKTKTVSRMWRTQGGFSLAAKGSFEGILGMAGAPHDVITEAVAAHEGFAGAGMRVIAVATSTANGYEAGAGSRPRARRFLGLVSFADPIREDVPATLEECRRAGVRVIVVTGDHASTARAVAGRLGWPAPISVVEGRDVDAADEQRLAVLAQTSDVFARSGPEQKHRLVAALQRHGEVVAMTGDGTNDAPALREADIGIAMGKRGTEVAREAADVILLDDDFSTIVRAVRDGRRIFDNLQRAFAYLIAFHMPLLVSAFAVPVLGAPLLLLPIHLVWLEVIVHPTSSLVFEADAGSPDLMRRPPRRPDAELVDVRQMTRALLDGGVLAVVSLWLYLHQLAAGQAVPVARAEAIAAMIVGQVGLILLERRPDQFLWKAASGSGPLLLAIAVLTLAGLFVAIQVPAVADVLQLAPLSAQGWFVGGGLGALAVLWREPLKLLRLAPRRQTFARTS